MNGILGLSELTLQTELTGEQRENIETVMRCGESLLDLINDLLDLSRIEAGKMTFEAVDFELADCFDRTLAILSPRAADQAIELRQEIAADVPPFLHGDPARLRQVLINLVGNAIKFTDDGSVVISASASPGLDDEVTLHVVVRDTGIGIPADRLESIFQSFVQADGTTTRSYGGTGLGLSISQQLIERMGGRIWVESEVGHGSTFGFALPLARAATRPSPPADPPAIAPADGGRAPREIRVLLVEDTPVNIRLARTILERYGCEVRVALDGRQALDALDDESFDLVFMDVQMPVMDGLEADPQDPRARDAGPRPAADRRTDRARDAHRPGALPRSGHGRLPVEAGPSGRPAIRGADLGGRRGSRGGRVSADRVVAPRGRGVRSRRKSRSANRGRSPRPGRRRPPVRAASAGARKPFPGPAFPPTEQGATRTKHGLRARPLRAGAS